MYESDKKEKRGIAREVAGFLKVHGKKILGQSNGDESGSSFTQKYVLNASCTSWILVFGNWSLCL